MPKRAATPFDKIMTTRAKLELMATYPDHFSDEDRRAVIADANKVVGWLMDFRNIVNGMVSFEEPPKDAAAAYVRD